MSYNKWMYTYSNPVNYTDPSGKCIDISVNHDPTTCLPLALTLGLLDPATPFVEGASYISCEVLIKVGLFTTLSGAFMLYLKANSPAIARNLEIILSSIDVDDIPKVDNIFKKMVVPIYLPVPTPPEPEKKPKSTPSFYPIPSTPKTITQTPEPNSLVTVYRGLGGEKSGDHTYFLRPNTSPSDFRIDADGVSTFELVDLPSSFPYALGFAISVKKPITRGSTGPIVDLPNCSGTFTPNNKGKRHWSLNCTGEPANVQFSKYAKNEGKNSIILNPLYTGSPTERKLK